MDFLYRGLRDDLVKSLICKVKFTADILFQTLSPVLMGSTWATIGLKCSWRNTALESQEILILTVPFTLYVLCVSWSCNLSNLSCSIHKVSSFHGGCELKWDNRYESNIKDCHLFLKEVGNLIGISSFQRRCFSISENKCLPGYHYFARGKQKLIPHKSVK